MTSEPNWGALDAYPDPASDYNASDYVSADSDRVDAFNVVGAAFTLLQQRNLSSLERLTRIVGNVLSNNLLAQPSTYVTPAPGPAPLSSDKRFNRWVKNVVGGSTTEASFLDENQKHLKTSVVERTTAVWKTAVAMFRALPAGMKLLVVFVALFVFLIMIPTLLALFQMLAESYAQTVRFVTLGIIYVCALLAWIFIKV